jgi:hypothetical protein
VEEAMSDKVTTLGEALPVEMARVRDEVMPAYMAIGSAGAVQCRKKGIGVRVENIVSKKQNRKHKKMKRNFVSWHYGVGLRGLFRAWSNSVFFVEWKWNIFGLLRTLFSPWHRDVTFRHWVGFHPILSLNTLISNIISRVIGSFVRIFVIAFGTALFFFVFSTYH